MTTPVSTTQVDDRSQTAGSALPGAADSEFRAQASVVLTGTSHGLGAALFAVYRSRSVRVLALGRRFTDWQYAAADADPDCVVLHHVDLGDLAALPSPDQLSSFLAGTAAGGTIVLVHNAATVGPVGLIGNLDTQQLAVAVQVNMVAPMALTNAFIAAAPRHVAALRVAFVTTNAVRSPYPGWAAYCATKAGAELFLRCANESADPRCVVQLFDPGSMDTAMHAHLRKDGQGLPGHDRLVLRHAAGELAEPYAVAAFLVQETLAGSGLPAPSIGVRRFADA